MKKLLKNLHRLLYLGSVFIVFCCCFPVLYFLAKNPVKHFEKIASIRRFLCIRSLSFVGFKIEVEYEQPIDWNQTYVLCPNHTSLLDIAIIPFLCHAPISFMGKEELLQNPVTRVFFKTIDIPVKRGSKMSSFRAYKKASEHLQDNKSVVIFPEGKIDDGFPPNLHPFKSGAFRLATENKIPILPIVIQDAWKILWDDGKKHGSKPGTIHVKVLSPLEVKEYDKQSNTALERSVFLRMKEVWDKNN
ncbi:MAG: lysophospholipid acyltransferase family protein [Sphingobacterium sp.]|uniref:lysophospholipid acyltransferase family protein n=1 Tax=Sphingobacterium sp. JB170 TaxID=1434842 RepID=UPI00097F3963|nr:lysophospholipid acyltransferase family protein [Sphingobacterium sp. JB170]SJN32482.1 1-acyl-sn-glycerol-3-phosphate acyltransferase [Sphingobacterium sp. JB170]